MFYIIDNCYHYCRVCLPSTTTDRPTDQLASRLGRVNKEDKGGIETLDDRVEWTNVRHTNSIVRGTVWRIVD